MHTRIRTVKSFSIHPSFTPAGIAPTNNLVKFSASPPAVVVVVVVAAVAGGLPTGACPMPCMAAPGGGGRALGGM